MICKITCLNYVRNDVYFDNKILLLERFPAKPYIREGYPGNRTAVVNGTMKLSCPPFSDLEPEVHWFRLSNYSIQDGEVGPRDAPTPPGYEIEVLNLDTIR